MCNDYGNRVPYSAYLEAFSQLKIRLFAAGGPPNLEPRDDSGRLTSLLSFVPQTAVQS
jgi:hypothetical protein